MENSINSCQTIRFQVFEIWNNNNRHEKFAEIMENYYFKIFLEHIRLNPRKTPAPKNFWPYSYQFYLCNPVKVFDAVVSNANTKPDITIKLLIAPDTDRETLTPEQMPTSLLNKSEIEILADPRYIEIIDPQLNAGKSFDDLITLASKKALNKRKLQEILPYINQHARALLPLRDTDKIAPAKNNYKRR